MTSRTFVLGAGASVPFGFPTGNKLRRQIVAGTDLGKAGKLIKDLLPMDFTESQIKEFHDRFRDSQRWSIDRFLADNPHFMRIGKACIATTLRENQAKGDLVLQLDDGNWLRRVFNTLMRGTDWPEREAITFVTFNYDLLVEHFFHNAFRSAFGLNNGEATEMRKKIKILHVHGSLGDYDPTVGVGGVIPTLLLQDWAKKISIVHEDQAEKELLEECRKAIASAKIVAFLGFGYAEENLVKIMPTELDWSNRFLGGSANGLENGEKPDMDSTRVRKQSAASASRPFVWGDIEDDCDQFLRKHPVLQ